MEQVAKNKTNDVPTTDFLEAATTSRIGAGQNVFVFGGFRLLLFGIGSILNPTLSRMNLQSTQQARLLNCQATYVTKNQRMCEAVEQQKIEILVSPTVTTMGNYCRFVRR